MKLRESTSKDREGILRIASATWEGWDYVPLFLDSWIAEGGLYVAELAGEIVGITRTTEFSPGELWLEALRIAEEHRKKGLGGQIAEQQLELALAANPKSIRLSTADVNIASLAIIRHLGFKEYAAFDYYKQQSTLAPSGAFDPEATHLLQEGKEEIEKAWKLIKESDEFKASRALFPHTWKFHEWDEGFFKGLVEKRLVRVTDDSGGLLILIPNRYNPKSLEIAFIEGDETSLLIMEDLAREEIARLPKDSSYWVVAFVASKHKREIIKRIGLEPHEFINKVYVFDYPLGSK